MPIMIEDSGIFQLGDGELQTQTGKVRGIGRRIQRFGKPGSAADYGACVRFRP
jgi:hypothetical protein